MKIIILDHEPFNDRRRKHFFVDNFFKEGWKVEYWCIQKTLNYSKNVIYNYGQTEDFVFYFDSKKELLKQLYTLDRSSTFLFLEFPFVPDTLFIFEKLNELKLSKSLLAYYRNPVTNFHCSPILESKKRNRSFLEKKISFFKGFLLNPAIRRSALLLKFRPNYFRSLQTFKFCFVTGNSFTNLVPSEKYISIDYFDVEDYENIKTKESLLPQPYIVFTDIFLGKHPDLQKNNASQYINEEEYYRKVREFFDKLEDELNLQVVIAAHPKAQYEKEFGDRLYFYNQTALLVKNCEFVITHGSISTSFALMAKKKVVHFYTNEFLQKDNKVLLSMYHNMCNVSERIKGICINVDLDINLEQIISSKVDSELYDNILSKYFLKNEKSSSNFDIVKKTIFNYIGSNGI